MYVFSDVFCDKWICLRNLVFNSIIDISVNTIMVAKPDKGRMLENMLIQMAQRGQIMGRMSEDDLKGILEQVNKQFQTKTTVKVGFLEG